MKKQEVIKGLERAERLGENNRRFTGLLDKNRVEIYEGDIVKYGRVSFNIEFRDDSFEMIGINIVSVTKLSRDYKSIEVIGNIYENPLKNPGKVKEMTMNEQLNPVIKDICNSFLIKDRGYGLCVHRENRFAPLLVVCKLTEKSCIGGKENCSKYEGTEKEA